MQFIIVFGVIIISILFLIFVSKKLANEQSEAIPTTNFKVNKDINDKEGFSFVAIDFETANLYLNSACSIGLVEIKNNCIVNKYYTLIKPPILSFDKKNSEITHLNENDVKYSPTFLEIWPNIKKYFNGDYLITAYNASFDMRVLKSCLDEYNIEMPNFKYFCAMNLATNVCNTSKKTLQCRCEHFGIDLNNAHNALCDTKACANIVLSVLKVKEDLESFKNILTINEFSNVKANSKSTLGNKPYGEKINIKEITPSTPSKNTNNLFYNKNIVFTGNMEKISRKDAMQKVVNAGGILKSGVSKKVDYLICGIQDKKIVGDDGLSSKQRKALELIEQGIDIKIVNENDFLKIINKE